MKKLGVFQAQSAIVRNHDGEAVSIHRTYLSDTCASKADVPMPKKLTESWKDLNGAAIRLGPAQECLSIAEGIETALAVSSATGATCWAAISASILQNFVPPEGVKRVIIWADKDRSGAGEYSARVLKDQLWAMGIPTMIMLPKSDIPEGEKSIDWLDVVANQLEDIPYLADMKVAA
jgi:putative DNA primase/helicase